MFGGLENPTHWLIVIAIALIVLGPKRLPEAGRALGTSLRGFKDSLSGEDHAPQVTQTAAEPAAPVASPAAAAERAAPEPAAAAAPGAPPAA